ncbi:MAG: Hpt domain-containing protein [Lachnospiraceae bacterium]|nr:Hpt domain-containing protein [Lachnospiraceae bacterium]
MNRYVLVKAGIDYNGGMQRFRKKELYEKFLLSFPQDENFRKLEQAIAAKDVEQAFHYAHAFKGIVGNLSIQKLMDAVVPLVEELRGGSMEHADELFAVVREDYEQIIAVLHETPVEE